MPTPNQTPNSPFILCGIVMHAAERISPIQTTLATASDSGQHIPGRYNGHWFVHSANLNSTDLFVPHRNKKLTVRSAPDLPYFNQQLSDLDTLYEPEGMSATGLTSQGLTQREKLARVLADAPEQPGFVIANVNSVSIEPDRPVHGSFYLLVGHHALHMSLVFDSKAEAVMLVWSTEPVRQVITAQMTPRNAKRYSFYDMPKIQDRAMFIHTQYLCSRWWDWSRSVKHAFANIALCNAVETYLYRV